MKRDQIKKLLGENATDEIIDAIMKLHGESVQANQTQLTDLTKQLETANQQITDANAQIEKFKGMKPDELQAAATEWKTKFEQAQEEAKTQLAALKFDHALEGALTGAKVKNVKSLLPHLDLETIKKGYNEKDGTFATLEGELTKVKEAHDYLFESAEPTPRIVTGGNNKPVVGDAIIDAARKAAGLSTEQK